MAERARADDRDDADADACARPFLREVAVQLGADGATRAHALLRACAEGADAGAALLLADDALLAAAYSNLDLFPIACGPGDRVGAALRAALERL